MRKIILAAAFTGGLLALGSPALAQGGGMMSGGMMSGRGLGMMGRFSQDDMLAFADAHIAALHAGLKLSAEQDKLWPPVEEAMRNLARLHVAHLQAMRQGTGLMIMSDPIGGLRNLSERMAQGAEALRKLADAAAPLYAKLDDAQKRRLPILVRGGPRGMMMGAAMMRRGLMGAGMTGRGMMDGRAGAMMRDWFGADDDDDDQDSR